MSDNDRILLPESPINPYPLGRHVWHDPRNRLHRALEAPQLTLPKAKDSPWYRVDIFDQQGSSCTANAVVGLMRTSPFRDMLRPTWQQYDTEQERFDLYREAQRNDPWPGEEPTYEGTSTDAPLKVLKDREVIKAYKWLFGPDEVREYLQYHGPCVVGTNWYNSMFHPIMGRSDATIRLDSGSGVAGGHAYGLVFYDQKRKRYRMVNSWGRSWGWGGRAWLAESDLERLLAEQGDAVTVVIP